MNAKKTIFITGSTGLMGSATISLFSRHLDKYRLRLLARPSKKNEKKLEPFLRQGMEVVWGDLGNASDVDKAMGDAEIVLHIGGMVPPIADRYPEKTLKVNEQAARNIVAAALSRPEEQQPAVVYIGSVAETGCHDEPHHWGRTGDPVLSSPLDCYGISKILAERVIVESGLKRWVVLRQSGILHGGLLATGMNPITFHVPLRGVLEWSTLDDSARLMLGVCADSVPEHFWNNFYHIGSGESFRVSNYEFECMMLKALGCPPPQKMFDPNWFATRNFHGLWFADSDRLEELIPFRGTETMEEHVAGLAGKGPWWIKLTPLAPAFVMKAVMKHIAKDPESGTLGWIAGTEHEQEIKAFFKSRADWEKIPDWEKFDLSRPSSEKKLISHGYDESKPESELSIADMKKAAEFRGGECLAEEMTPGDMATKLRWRCCFGHEFSASPALVLKGGHWCPECLPRPWRYDREARHNPFLAQIWHTAHDPSEDEVYGE